MKTYIIKRFLLMIPTLVGVSIIIYIIMAIIPGDVAIAILGNQATKRAADELREELGLNDPHHEQYFRWVKNMVTIDMGVSLFNTKRPIKDLVIQYFPVTFNLAIYAMVLSLVMGIGMGVLSAIKHDTWVDYVVRSIAILGLAIPNFWLAILIMLVLAWGWGWQADWIYVTPWENPRANISSLFWPTVTVALFLVSFIARMTRSQLLSPSISPYTPWCFPS